jgi:hypothetical protein
MSDRAEMMRHTVGRIVSAMVTLEKMKIEAEDTIESEMNLFVSECDDYVSAEYKKAMMDTAKAIASEKSKVDRARVKARFDVYQEYFGAEVEAA